jgi:hypothetical protein
MNAPFIAKNKTLKISKIIKKIIINCAKSVEKSPKSGKNFSFSADFG